MINGPILGGIAKLKYSASTTTVTCDGNSITAGIVHTSGPAAYFPAQLQAMAPISNQFAVTNLGISGQTTRKMNGLDGGSVSDVNATYVNGKKNVLFALEGTNSRDIANRTGEQMAQDLADYVADRLALHADWIIALPTVLPFIRAGDSQAVTDADNAAIDTLNALIRANYRAWGAKALVELRGPGSPFNLPDYTLASFETPALLALWATTATEAAGTHIHLRDSGMTFIAQAYAATLRRLPAR